MTEAEALTKLLTMVDLSVEPELTPGEAMDALTGSKRFGERGATAKYGDVIAVGDRLYRCVWKGNTTGQNPTVLGWTLSGQRVKDGTAQWEDIGRRPASEWDFTTAKWRLYDLRVQRSAQLVNESDQDYKQDVEALHKHWVAERAKVVVLRAV